MSQASWLLQRCAEFADRACIIWRDQPYTYAWLLTALQQWRERLDAAQVQTGRIVAIEGDYSPEVVALLLALIERSAILVPLTDSIEAHKPEFMEIAEVEVVIKFAPDGSHTITWREGAGTVTHELNRCLLELGEPGLVLFSSGSTGKNKAALHNLTPLLEKFKQRRHVWRTLTFLLLDHIGGVNTLFYILSNGGTIVAIEDRQPDVVCRAIEQHQVELLPTSPTFLNLLLISEAYTRFDLSSLRRITYGTEAMPMHTLERISALFPNVELQQTYGLSELGIMRSRSRTPDSLWMKVGGEDFETKIVDDVLWIRARSAMLGYLNAPSPFDAEGWFNTKDVVEVDGDYIRVLGRTSETINVGGLKVYPTEVESVLLQMENVQDVAVVGERNAITGQAVTARFNLVQPEASAAFRKRVRAFCREHLAPHKIPARIEIVDQEQHSGRFKKLRHNRALREEA